MSNCANKKACCITYSKLFCARIRESSKGILAIVPGFIDLTGKRFGDLYVIRRVENNKFRKARFLTRCEVEGCGNEKVVLGYRLTSKTEPMTHCGCLTSKHNSDAKKGKNITHGLSGTPEYDAEKNHKRRMRKQNNNIGADYSYDKIFKPDLDYCVYCGSIENLSKDHIMSIIKGGTQDPKNLVTACKSCNSSKNASFFIDWYGKNKDKKNLRSLDEIIKDMGFDDLEDLTNYQDELANNAWHNYGLMY